MHSFRLGTYICWECGCETKCKLGQPSSLHSQKRRRTGNSSFNLRNNARSNWGSGGHKESQKEE